MASSGLHIFFLPLITPGHMLPMVDMAKLFAERGVDATLVTTPGNAARIRDSIDRANATGGRRIQLLQVDFPSSVAGLPDGCDNLAASPVPDVTEDIFRALTKLRQPFEKLVQEHAPDCIVSDGFYPWTVDVAADFGIPRLVFYGPGAFSVAAIGSLFEAKPHQRVSGDAEAFVVPDLPDRIEMTRSQLPEFVVSPLGHMQDMGIADLKSYGVIMNSFRELEPVYATDIAGLKTWYIGPLSLCNRDEADKTVRGEKASGQDGCLNWLDAQAPRSVLYVCFGSLCRFTRPQLREIALGLESSGHSFLWVLRDVDNSGAAVLPEGFEERTKGRGRVLRGWSPQLLILGHRAVGGFMTHCGWNSTLESITAGVPMVAWPLFAEQFVNEKLIVHLLRVGVGVGAAVCSNHEEERVLVGEERVKEAVALVMGDGEEAEAMRRRARELAAMAKEAVEVGGSSHRSLGNLVQELVAIKKLQFVSNASDPFECIRWRDERCMVPFKDDMHILVFTRSKSLAI
ncbi:hypothetical protein Taro_039201 [Colocasia esculenta]|uniref:Glycosyltransferase n=1 Tax=Colocasia esculenta TaxID=4460 RepID=A0A843WFZ4_COLES|nr:hypothetical protein [Colocasia esculenta]